MKPLHLTLAALILALTMLAGCTITGADQPPFATLIPTPDTPIIEITPSPLPPATVTSLPSITPNGGVTATGSPGAAASTVPPTLLSTSSATGAVTLTPTPTRAAATGQPTWAGADEVLIFMIAIGDNGASGPVIGCEDSVVGVRRQIEPTRGPLRAALELLLSIKDRDYGESGLYNALYQSSLVLDDVAIISGTAKIELSGTPVLGGACDSPRVKAQIEHTALQFSTVQAVEITINGRPIDEALSQQ